MTQRRCPGCRAWYDKTVGHCPDCGEPPAAFNSWLHAVKLNNHLLGQAQRGHEEKKWEASYRKTHAI